MANQRSRSALPSCSLLGIRGWHVKESGTDQGYITTICQENVKVPADRFPWSKRQVAIWSWHAHHIAENDKVDGSGKKRVMGSSTTDLFGTQRKIATSFGGPDCPA